MPNANGFPPFACFDRCFFAFSSFPLSHDNRPACSRSQHDNTTKMFYSTHLEHPPSLQN